jgi:formamidopyrimidine-DNA glycosylase
MPELPEVEAIKLQLQKYLTGHVIVSVQINYGKKFEGDEKLICGARIRGARRFGKVLSMDLDNGYSILTHVKMTGQYIYRGPNLIKPLDLSKKVTGGAPGKHTHIIFKLDNGGILYFNDVRKFGWIKIVPTNLVESEKFIASLGPEPLRDLSAEKFKEILSKSGRPIKVVIMDQSKMGGVGNIYANDALWKAGINPQKSAKELSEEEANKLYTAIEDVLKEGIKWGGASELAFVTPDGREGQYQGHTLAYGHDGQPCERCKKTIFEKYFLGGRGTYWCRFCQK